MTTLSKTEHIETVEAVSAGGVAFRTNVEDVEIAIIRTSEEGRWQLPKGLIDPGETAEQAALREVREEAGVTCEMMELIDTIEYWFYGNYDGPRKRYHKKVHFYLMKYIDGNVADHDDEVSEARWVRSDDAINMLSFSDEQKIVQKALVRIGSIGLA